MKHLTECVAWKALGKHAQSLQLTTIKTLVAARDAQTKTCFSAADIELDIINQRLTPTTLELLLDLAQERGLENEIEMLFHGGLVNRSKKIPALHTALRQFDGAPLLVNNHDVLPDVFATREKMRAIATQIRTENWLGHTGKPIKHLVNIGIGGSDLGARFCLSALGNYISKDFSYHFVSDAYPDAFRNAVTGLDPEATLFIIASKSFTTQETLYNGEKALSWLGDGYQAHVIAITAQLSKAKEMGIKHILPIWDWVGGRYSSCSAVNLITAIALGMDQFDELLAGANSLDQHFQHTEFSNNLPILLALLGIWNNNFLQIHNLLILVYAQQLEQLVPYVQQLDMESNGKSLDNLGRAVNYATAPIIWGGSGNQAQHSYYQLLCQGTPRTTVDLIKVNLDTHRLINSKCQDHQRVLTDGVSDPGNGYIPGNIPLNQISLKDYSPRTIGALIALYEHKIFTQAAIWNINPFDQPGVESAKRTHRTTGRVAELAF